MYTCRDREGKYRKMRSEKFAHLLAVLSGNKKGAILRGTSCASHHRFVNTDKRMDRAKEDEFARSIFASDTINPEESFIFQTFV